MTVVSAVVGAAEVAAVGMIAAAAIARESAVLSIRKQ
jgi:hypothetical protein